MRQLPGPLRPASRPGLRQRRRDRPAHVRPRAHATARERLGRGRRGPRRCERPLRRLGRGRRRRRSGDHDRRDAQSSSGQPMRREQPPELRAGHGQRPGAGQVHARRSGGLPVRRERQRQRDQPHSHDARARRRDPTSSSRWGRPDRSAVRRAERLRPGSTSTSISARPRRASAASVHAASISDTWSTRLTLTVGECPDIPVGHAVAHGCFKETAAGSGVFTTDEKAWVGGFQIEPRPGGNARCRHARPRHPRGGSRRRHGLRGLQGAAARVAAARRRGGGHDLARAGRDGVEDPARPPGQGRRTSHGPVAGRRRASTPRSTSSR